MAATQPTVPSFSPSAMLGRLVDARPGEGATLVRTAGALFLMVGAHATLETARDALLLSHFPARALGAVYVAAALAVVPAAALVARLSSDGGPRRVLIGG